MVWMLGTVLSSAIVLSAGTVMSLEPEPTKTTTTAPASAPASTPKFAAPTKSASGKSLVIPEDQKKLGTVYQTVPGTAKQVTFTSKAHNAEFTGYSAGVIGYAITGSAESPADLKGGAWILPVKSLDTGNRTKNKNLTKPEWLDSEKNPDIIFVLKSVKGVEVHKAGGAGKSFKCTLVGEMTMRGVTRELEVKDAILGFVTGSDKTEKIAKGDLLAIRCKYKVKLTDFGVTNDSVLKDKSVADEIEIDQSLTLATAAPEDQPVKAPASEDSASGQSDK